MKHLKKLIVLLLLTSNSLFSQTKIEFSDFTINIGFDDKQKVGKEMQITLKDGSKLAKGKYIAEAKEKNNEVSILFEIDESGYPFGTIESKYGKYRHKYTLKDRIIERFDVFEISANRLIKEEFIKKDSIISTYYPKKNQKILIEITYKGIVLYKNNCSYDKNGLKIYSGEIQDEIKGERTSYYGERITFNTKWKNLPKGISKITKQFNEDGTTRTKETAYLSGTIIKKTTDDDGSYEVETISKNGHTIEKYLKNGKLIETYTPVFPNK